MSFRAQNLFLATGWSVVPAHSFILGAEISLSFIIYKVLPTLMEGNIATIEVKRSALDNVEQMMEGLDKSTINQPCPAYYKYYYDSDVKNRLQKTPDGKQLDYKIAAFYPGLIEQLPDERKEVHWDDFLLTERESGKWMELTGPREIPVKEILGLA